MAGIRAPDLPAICEFRLHANADRSYCEVNEKFLKLPLPVRDFINNDCIKYNFYYKVTDAADPDC